MAVYLESSTDLFRGINNMVNFLNIINRNSDFTQGEIVSVSLSYLWLLRPSNIFRYSSINIELVNDVERRVKIDGVNRSICNIYNHFDSTNLKNLSKQQRIKILYEIIFHSVHELATLSNSPTKYLEQIEQEIIKYDYNPVLPFFKLKKAKNKKIYIDFVFRLNSEFAEFFIRQFDSNKIELIEKSIYKTCLNPFVFKNFFKKCFFDENVYKIENETKEIYFCYNILNQSFFIEYRPRENTIDYLQEYLKALDYKTSNKERNKLLGLPNLI